jgi:hypothetical protein
VTDPRVFGVTATANDVVAVIRRGPSGWFHLGRWDLAHRTYEPGAWLHGTLYPQRCDLSPDGRYFSAFTLRPWRQAAWPAGNTYVSISRLPWLTSLAAWATAGTCSWGVAFAADRGVWDLGPPDVGDAEPLRRQWGLELNRAVAFAVERRRGWHETSDTPPRKANDYWDEQRGDRLRMEKLRPDGRARLVVGGHYAAFRGTGSRANHYWLDTGDGATPLLGVQWAEWAADGMLLVATTSGALQIRDAFRSGTPEWSVDLSSLVPAPAPPPQDARRW